MRERMTARGAMLMLVCLAGQAQEPVRPPDIFRVESKVVQVPVIVTDKLGRNINALRAADFEVLDNGVPQTVTLDDFSSGLPPISLVVAVQCSRTSQLALPDIRRIAAMIQPLITGARGEAAVLAFDREIRWVQDFTRNEEKIYDAMKSLKTGAGGARIFDALTEAAERLSPRKGRKVMLLISQSNDSGSHIKLKDAIQTAERDGIEIFAAHYSAYAMSWIARSEDFPDKPTLDQMFYTELARLGSANHSKALAFATGGVDYSFARQQGLDKAIEQLGAEVHSQYILSFPQHEDTPGVHRIGVSIPGREDLRIRARLSYWVEQESR